MELPDAQQLRIIYQGRFMTDTQGLKECKVVDGDTTAMHLIIKSMTSKPESAPPPRSPPPSPARARAEPRRAARRCTERERRQSAKVQLCDMLMMPRMVGRGGAPKP